MDKDFIDRLYHELRLLCISGDPNESTAVLGITTHLTKPGGDYPGLLQFLAYYGSRFLLEHAYRAVCMHLEKPERIVEFGAGLAWLGRGLSNRFGVPSLHIDKRQTPFIDLIADLEAEQGRKLVLSAMKDGDLIVMSELLHCLDDPREVLASFSRWPMLIIEFRGHDVREYANSYVDQIAKFGCKPVVNLATTLGRGYVIGYTSPHAIVTVKPGVTSNGT